MKPRRLLYAARTPRRGSLLSPLMVPLLGLMLGLGSSAAWSQAMTQPVQPPPAPRASPGPSATALAAGALTAVPPDGPLANRLRALELAINRVQQEQQATYQQFQLVQELRRNAQQEAENAGQATYSASVTGLEFNPPNYDDVARARKERQDRIQGYSEQMNTLYERYRQLDERRQLLLAQMDALLQQAAR